jgi:hypothetical protein
VRWAMDCDFYGNDVGHERSSGEECGPKCEAAPGCWSFTWTDYEGGTCWMKGAGAREERAAWKQGAVCGYLTDQPTPPGPSNPHLPTSYNVRTTRWAPHSDIGGEKCHLYTSYCAVESHLL